MITKTEEINYNRLLVNTPEIKIKERVSRKIEKNPIVDAIIKEVGEEVCEYINEHYSLANTNSILFASSNQYSYELLDFDNLRAIINLKKLNHIRNINDFLKAINKLLPDAGIYVGCVETYMVRKERFFNKMIKPVAHVAWFLDFVVNRVFPRLKFSSNLYYKLTDGKVKAISRAEALGRVAYCGFDIIESKVINGLNYFVVMKTSEPKEDVTPSSGPLFPMTRIGKNGKLMKVYKVRTMHPYSEFIQDYIVKLNGYNEAGKPKDDFRISNWGKFIRKIWIDEIPQFFNLITGEVGIVGVRPLSRARFNELPEDVQNERIKHRPGCIPPYVALNMPDAIGNIEAERIYFSDIKKHGKFITDFKYFFMGVYNILTNKIRSA